MQEIASPSEFTGKDNEADRYDDRSRSRQENQGNAEQNDGAPN
jgi:hypothetical protein